MTEAGLGAPLREEDGALSAGALTVARGLRRATLSPGTISLVATLLDVSSLALGLWFAGFVTFTPSFDPLRTAAVSMLAAGAAVSVIWTCGGYRLSTLRRARRGLVILFVVGLLLAAIARVFPAALFLLVVFILPARALGAGIAGAALDYGLTERRALIIGGDARGAQVMADLAATPGNDIRVCGIFDDRDDSRSPPVVAGIPKLGTLDSLLGFARAAEIDMLIVTLPLSAERRIRVILKAVEVLPLDVRLSDFSADAGLRRHGQRGSPGGLIDVMSRPLRNGQLGLKRALDILGAAAAIVLLAPLLLVTALAIKLETRGPILFRQPRRGYNHRPVEVWKFRSMYAADCDPQARKVVTRGDPRITRVGRLIRRWSIDELPQLFNVLAGELSLVGPRPHPVAAVSSRQESFEAIVEGYAARHKVRPGVTGWAQIHGWRGEIDDPVSLRRRVEHDLHYIENWSIWLDLYILAVTPFRLLDPRHAY